MTYSLQHAKYHDGALILDEELSGVYEGEEFDLLLLKKDVDRMTIDEFISSTRKHHFIVPESYHFSREEANAR